MRALLAHLGGSTGVPYVPTPWFWSEQYDHRLQLAGHVPTGAQFEVRQGTLERPPWFGVYVHDGREVAACSLDMPAPIIRWQRDIARADQ